MTSFDTDAIGFVGTGHIGAPMVRRLLAVGHRVRAVARNRDAHRDLALAGAEVVASAQELASCRVVICCLFDDHQLLEVFGGGDGLAARLPQGALIISHTTGSPVVLRHLASRLAPVGGGVVDAAFSGTAADVRAQVLTVLLGGTAEHVTWAESIVKAYADPVLRTGALGSAMCIKLLNNLLFAAHAQLALTAVAAAEQLGVLGPLFVEAVKLCSGASEAFTYLERQGGPEPFSVAVAPYLSKDVAISRSLAKASGLDLTTLVQTALAGPLNLGDAND